MKTMIEYNNQCFILSNIQGIKVDSEKSPANNKFYIMLYLLIGGQYHLVVRKEEHWDTDVYGNLGNQKKELYKKEKEKIFGYKDKKEKVRI